MREELYINKKQLTVKLLVLFLGFTLFAGFSLAQAKTSKNDTPEKTPLALRLSIPKAKICSDEKSLKLRVEIINDGNKPLMIDKTALGISYNVSYFKKGLPNGIWLKSYGLNQKYGDYILLAPDQKFNESLEFSFLDEKNKRDNFFDRTGRYDIEMKYQIQNFDKNSSEIAGTIYTEKLISNKVSFYLKGCRSK